MSFDIVFGDKLYSNYNSSKENRAEYTPVTKPNKVTLSVEGNVFSIAGVESDVTYILRVDGKSVISVSGSFDIISILMMMGLLGQEYSITVQGYRLGIGGDVSDPVIFETNFVPAKPVLSSSDVSVDSVTLSWV